MPVIIPDLQTAIQSSSNALETKPQVISPVVDPEVPQPDLSVFQPLLYQPSTGLSYQGSGTVISSTNGIKIYDEGNLVLSKAIALNFIGDAVEVTANGSTAYITISGTGGSSYGNSNVSNFLAHYGSNTISTTGNVTVNGLFANTIQNLNGLTVNNGDSSHGQTSGLTVVSNGDGNDTTLFNTYGNIVLASSNTGTSLNYFTFDKLGNVYFPNKLSVTGSILSPLFRINDSGNTNWQLYGNTLTATTGAKWVSNTNTNDDYILSNIGGFIHFQSLFANANIASEFHLEHGQAHIIVNDGTSQEWIFETTGNLNLPSEGNIVGFTANNSGHIQWIGNSSGDGAGYTTLGLIPDDTLVGNDQYLIIDPTAPGHIHIRAGGTQDNSSADLFLGGENSYFKVNAGANNEVRISANSYPWVFGADGIMTVPGEGVIRSIGDSVTLQSYNVGTGNVQSVYLGSGGGIGFFDQDIGGNWLEIFRSGAEPQIRVPVGRGNLNVQTAEGINAYDWVFDNTGNLTLPGNTFSVNYANGTAVSLDGNYSNANVVANLAALGSNPISTTGNITGGNIIGTFVSPATTANTYVLYNDSGLVGGSAVFTFNESGNILTIGTTGGTLKVADISTPQAGVNLRFIPSSGTTLSYGHLNPQFANTYDLGSSSSRWDNVYANVANIITLNTVGNITGNTAGYTIGYRDIPQITFSANATAALDDAGKHYYSTTAGNLSLTLPDNSNVALSTGATLTVVVNAAGNVLVNQGTGVSLYMAGSSTTGNRVVGAYGLASVMKVAANTWVISGTGVY